MTLDRSNTEYPSAPGSADSETEKDHDALARGLAAADKLAKLASTVPLINRTLDGNRTES